MEKLFSVPLISENLRPQEAYIQILDNLAFLEKACDEIFGHIDNRNAEQKHRLKAINDRVAAVETRISSLKGSKKAIRVLAPATYPNGIADKKQHAAVLPQRTTEPVHSSIPVKSKFKESRTDPRGFELPALIPGHADSGLLFDELISAEPRKAPESLRTISSLLLFNTDQNAYYGGESSQLNEMARRKLPETTAQTPSLDAAPPSFTQFDGMRPKDDLTYVPSFGDVPEFDLPNTLPDLQGIVDDFAYDDLEFDGGLGDLPKPGAFTLEPPAPLKPLAPSNLSQPPVIPIVPAPTQSLPSIPGTEPPAPPVVKTSLPTIPGVSSPVPAPPPPPPFMSPAPAAPPPPQKAPMSPPPPPPPVPPVAPSNAPETPSKPAASSGSGDARSSLLASIREFGGEKGKLKNVKDRKIEQKKKKQEEKEKAATASSGGGDLMGDLKKRLTNMRKGISEGKRSAELEPVAERPAKGFGNNAMDQLNKMIPHSPTPQAARPPEDADWSD